MAAPVVGIQVTKTNWVPRMKHFSIPHIHPDMAHRAGGCVGPGKKDQVSGFCLLAGYDGTLAIDSLRCRPGQVVDAGLRIDPADISAAVKGRGRGRAAPHIGKANIAGSLREQRPVASVPHGLSRRKVTGSCPAIDCRGIDPLGVGPCFHGQAPPQQALQIPADLLLVGEENGHHIGFLRDAPILFLYLPGPFFVAQEAFQEGLLRTAGELLLAMEMSRWSWTITWTITITSVTSGTWQNYRQMNTISSSQVGSTHWMSQTHRRHQHMRSSRKSWAFTQPTRKPKTIKPCITMRKEQNRCQGNRGIP